MTTKTAPPPGILLLGATGQVGRELLRTVGRLGPVTATARTSSELAGARTVIPLDVTDLDALRLTVCGATVDHRQRGRVHGRRSGGNGN